MIRRQMIFEDSSQSFRVVISGEVVKHMFRLCDASRSRETGGILIGSYSSDLNTAHVVEATSPPADSRFGRDWFHRGTDGLEELLVERWDGEARAHYVGDWHFHSENVPWPSPQDKKQMREVAGDRRYNCSQPLLIIVCPVQEGQWVLECFVFPRGAPPQTLRMLDGPRVEEAEREDEASLGADHEDGGQDGWPAEARCS